MSGVVPEADKWGFNRIPILVPFLLPPCALYLHARLKESLPRGGFFLLPRYICPLGFVDPYIAFMPLDLNIMPFECVGLCSEKGPRQPSQAFCQRHTQGLDPLSTPHTHHSFQIRVAARVVCMRRRLAAGGGWGAIINQPHAQPGPNPVALPLALCVPRFFARTTQPPSEVGCHKRNCPWPTPRLSRILAPTLGVCAFFCGAQNGPVQDQILKVAQL